MISAADNVWHEQPGIGGLGFRFTVEERSPDSLELMIGYQSTLLKIDGLPRQAENLALTKAENQNQYVCRVKRIRVGSSGFEKTPGLIAGPRS